jgi:Fe(3+) dicitrate transport protein
MVKPMTNILLIVYLIIICPPTFSQATIKNTLSGAIKGNVIDAYTKEQLVGVNVYIENTIFGSASDEKGNFSITGIPNGRYTLTASMIGYKSEFAKVHVREDVTVECNFQLNEKVLEVGTGKIDTLLKTYEFPQVNVIGKKLSLLKRIPGSANLISEINLKNIKPVTGNEMFKKVTGINVVDEEGAGLRTNIGIRGLDPDRSRSVLMMEDGVPIALAPYGEPEMYYTPAIDRMQSIEVLKGSGSILYGPQTIGGVINFITADPPLHPSLMLNIKAGESGYLNGQASYGTTVDNIGFQLNYLHKRADKLGITKFDINDLTAKMKFNTGINSRIGLKLAIYDENSNSTYVGLSQSMYENKEYFTIIAPNDKLEIRRYSANLTHDFFFSERSFLRTTIYGYTTTRNWLRQDFSRNPVSNGTGVVFGDTTASGGVIYMMNSTGNRNRKFEVAGIEPRIHLNFLFAGIENELEGGLRLHFERAFEQRVNGDNANAKSGALRDDEIRTGYASSVFAQNRIYLSQNFILSPGLRLENFYYERDIFRINYIDTSITNNNNIFAVIPGIGFNYNISNSLSFFTGIHKGFAPPRIKDAITSDGEALQLNAESSWNYEVGLRTDFPSILYFEITGFVLDFSNQIIPVSQSSGGDGTGLVNGGETLHMGIETSFRFDLHKIFNSDYLISMSANSTYVRSKYSGDRFIKSSNNTINIKNNRLPYAPDFTFTGSFNVNTPMGLGIYFSATYISSQFTDELNTIDPLPNGETGKIPSYVVLDLTSSYNFPNLNSTFYISIKNLLDDRYIASRRPQGIKVGLPRFITAGVELNLL